MKRVSRCSAKYFIIPCSRLFFKPVWFHDFIYCNEITGFMENSVEPDQLTFEADLDLHCHNIWRLNKTRAYARMNCDVRNIPH